MRPVRSHKSSLRIALVAAPGGHFAELLILRPAYEQWPHFYVTNPSPIRTTEDLGTVYRVPDYAHGSLLRRSYALVGLLARSVLIYFMERPNVLISTGPATGLALAFLVWAYGDKIMFIECSAQVTSPSRSGRVFRWIADPLFIQWPSLQRHYPDAEYGGLLL